ncbi:MAG TPA: AAA family ATPase [Candidatus Dormibacteraeota bacterium]|nr:AAA family ATPase [Candidatus Dormibacteraeota bacterium]
MGESQHDREGDTYLSAIRPAEYEALLECTRENVECGNSAIMVAPFIRKLGDPAWCRTAAAGFGGLGAVIHAVWVHCDAESMRTRLAHRGAARDSSKLANWDRYLEGVDLGYTPAMPHTVMHNSPSSVPLRAQAGRLLASLSVI